MLFIVFAILLSVLLLIIFKQFHKWNIDTVSAIIINYLVACVCGYFISKISIVKLWEYNLQWKYFTIPLGILFISVFYGISLTAQKIGVSIASLANKMSVVIPILLSILLLNEKISLIQTIGIVSALVGVYLCLKPNQRNKNKKIFWLPLLVFLGSGIIDAMVGYSSKTLLNSGNESAIFTQCIFLNAFIAGGIFTIIKYLVKNNSWNYQSVGKNLLGGLLIGIPNFFSIYFIYKALEISGVPTAILFPILNISNVLLSALIGYLFYQESYNFLNKLGFALSVIALVLISI